MNKDDLKYGNVVETREGFRYLYINNEKNCYIDWLVSLDKKDFDIKNIYNYRDDLTYDNMSLHYLDIMKVYKDYTLKDVIWERKEKPKLTEEERIILRSIDKCFKYIARDKNGILRICAGERLSKMSYQWYSTCYYSQSFPYTNLFKFIKWEDEKPYLIEDLLKEE